jgi:ParB/RepB/Spo0J family partition protein
VSAPRMMNIGPSGIIVLPERLRKLRPEVVAELIESMRERGQLQPIVLRPSSGTRYYLVAGRHRLEAAKRLKWPSIKAMIIEGMAADEAALAEIDENLIRADLTPAERALHVGRRKELYEAKHPETKKGAAGRGRKKSQLATSKPAAAFIEDTARKTGKHRATVARDAARAKIVVLADVASTCLDKGDELDALAKLPEREQRTLANAAKKGKKVSAKTRVKQFKRAEREAHLAAKQMALPTKKYGVIVADPEWQWEPWSHETGMDRAAANHYPTSILPVIAARDVPSISAKDCVLFLWATGPMNPHALVVMAAWGFDYKAQYIWGKDKFGTGFWNREKHELLLIGTRGQVPCPAQASNGIR